jgi:hypothetical protein
VGWNDPVNKKATVCNQSTCYSLSYSNGWVWNGVVAPYPAGTNINKFTAAWTSPQTNTESLCAGNLCYRYNLQSPVGWQADQDVIGLIPTSTPTPTPNPYAGEKPTNTPTPTTPTSVANCTVQGLQRLNNYYGRVVVALGGSDQTSSPFKYTVPGNSNITAMIDSNVWGYRYLRPVRSTLCINRTDCHSTNDPSARDDYFRNDIYCPAGGYADLWFTSREPNCYNIKGPTRLSVGQAGAFTADFFSYEGNLTGEIYLNNFEKSIGSKTFTSTSTSGSISGSWTPTAPGTYTINCRAWNDGIAECRSSGYNDTQRQCNGLNGDGSNNTLTVVVTAPTATPVPPTKTPVPPSATPTPTTKPTSTPVPTTDTIIRLNEIESAPTTNDRPTVAAYALNSNFQKSICAGDPSIPHGYRCPNLVQGTTYTYRATSTARSTSVPTIVSEINGAAYSNSLYDLWMTYADKVTLSTANPSAGQAVIITVTGKKLRPAGAKLTVHVTGAGGFVKDFSEEITPTTSSPTTFTKTYAVTPTTAGFLAVDLTVAEGYAATIPASVLSYKSFSFSVQNPTPTLIPPTATPTKTPVVATNTPVPPSVTSNPTCSLRAKGDANCDNVVDLLDYTCWRSEFLGNKPVNCVSADFDGVNGVDILDFTIWKITFLATP